MHVAPIAMLAVLSWAQPDAKTSGPEAAAAKQDAPIEVGDWLVHEARHRGHSVGRTDARSAALHVLALLRSALEVAPKTAEAHRWTYDLLGRLGREDAARAALTKYIGLVPSDEAARLRGLELELDRLQTAQARAKHVRAELGAGSLPRSYESELRRVLARFHYERRQNDDAAREIERSLRLNPLNVRARELAYEMFVETEAALQRVELALQLVAANPSQAHLAWDLGEFLDQRSLHRQAQEWYNRAIELHRRSAAGAIPAVHWHTLALSYSHSGDHQKSKQAATAALTEDPVFHAARILRSHANRRLGDAEAAEDDLAAVASVYEPRVDEVIAKGQAGPAAEMAWFYCYHKPHKERALRLATLAMKAPVPSSLARLAMGYALRMNARYEEAAKLLDPLADVDQLAALEYARILLSRGDRSRGLTALHKGALLQLSGVGYELIKAELQKYDETAPQRPLHSKIVRALERFDRRIFDYHKRPAEFLDFSLRFVDKPIPSVGPVRVLFRIENKGPFPITLGEGFMARPLAVVSVKIGDDPGASFDNYVQVMLNARTVLWPSDAIEKTVAIDVGPMREHLLRTASVAQELKVAATFDPVYRDGVLSAGAGSIVAEPIVARRPAVDVSPAGLTKLASQATSGGVAERIVATDQIGAILAGAQANTPNLPGDLDGLRAALATCLTDPDWRVRTRALVACGWSKLDDRLTNAAAQAVRDRHPLVRMLAMRLFADQQGEQFRIVLDAMAKSDPDRNVRIMARSYLPAEAVAASAPTPDDS